MPTATYAARRGRLETCFDRTASQAWARLTSDAPVSRVRATVRAGRDAMRELLLSWLGEDLRGRRLLDAGCGTGALAIEAARRGADVVAIDIAGSLVAVGLLRRRQALRDPRPTGAAAVSEYHYEPVRGLPGLLPRGERMLWQGSPDWRELARGAFLGGPVAIYFAVLMLWRLVAGLADGVGIGAALTHMPWVAPVAAAALGLIALLAWATARSTVYTITSRRVVLRIGVALTMSVNVPFRRVVSAAVKAGRHGFGDIALRIGGEDRFAYLMLWPHVRPRQFKRPEPMLRALPHADTVARLLADALMRYAAANGAQSQAPQASDLAARSAPDLVAAE